MTILKDVQPGEPLVIPAHTHNAWNEAARFAIGTRQGIFGNDAARNQTRVSVYNSTAVEVPSGGVMVITEAEIKNTDDDVSYFRETVMKGTVPTDDICEQIAIMIDSLGPDEDVGDAVIAGIATAQVNILHPFHRYAHQVDGVVDNLESGLWGSCKILDWEDRDATGIQWCKVLCLGFVPPLMYSGKNLGGAIAVDTSGTIDIFDKGSDTGWDEDNVYLDWAHGDVQIDTGKEVMATYLESECRSRIIIAECN